VNTATIRAAMAKRVAGIPVGIFALLFAGVILFFAIRMRSSTSAADTTATDPTVATDGGNSDSTQQPDFVAKPVGSVTQEPATVDGNTPDTNDAWSRRAIVWLSAPAQGYSVDVATSAITKYLNSEQLTVEETKARNQAITQFGYPPEIPEPGPPAEMPVDPPPTGGVPSGPAGPGTTNPPATKQGEPPLHHTVMGSRDNTPAELARVYYGTTNIDATEKIKAANTTLTPPYPVGTKVKIPENYQPHYFVATAHIDTQYEIAKRNSTTPAKIEALNPAIKHWPVKAGTRVRVK
jgi:hypothetical protein